MHIGASHLCRHCSLTGVVLTVDDRIVFVDHSPLCSRGRGDREFYGGAAEPIYFKADDVTPVEFVEAISVGAERWTRVPLTAAH